MTPLPPGPYTFPDALDWLATEDSPLAPSSAQADRGWRVEYEAALARALLLSDARVVQMVVVPAFDPEEAVSVELHRGECRVVATQLSGNLHSATSAPLDEGPPDPLPTATLANAPLSAAACEAVRSAWDSALRAAKSPQAPYRIAADGRRVDLAGVDGTAYHFADRNVDLPPELEQFLASCDFRGAVAESAPQGTRLADLVGLGRLLAAYARAPRDRRDALASELATVASRVRDRLERDRARDPELARKARFETALVQRLPSDEAGSDVAVTATRYASYASLPAADRSLADSRRRELALRDEPVWIVTATSRCPRSAVGGGYWAIFDERSERLVTAGVVR